MRKMIPLVAFLVIASMAISVHAAFMTFMTVTATKQGQFKGEVNTKEHKDAISVLSFIMEVDSPRDPASGLLTGKRLHKPIIITKDVDSSSPQFFQSLTTNETLKIVVFEFAKPALAAGAGGGTESVYYKITLTNASISTIRQFTADAANGHAPAGTALEEIALTYQKIEVESTTGKTSAVDDWQAK